MTVVAPAMREPGDRGVADPAAADDGDAVAAADVAGVHGGTEAGHHAAAEQAGGGGRRLGSTFVHWPAATSVFSSEGADAQRGLSSVPSASVIFWVALWVAKQYQGLPLRQARHSPADRAPVEDHEVAGRHVGDPLTDGLDDAGRLVAEQEREVVVDAALAVVQVGVADAAGLHLDQRLTRAGVGDQHGLQRHRPPLARATTPCTSCGMTSPP